jgi:hypothetical protein
MKQKQDMKRRKYNNPCFTIGTQKSDPPVGTCSNCKSDNVELYEKRYRYNIKSDMWLKSGYHIEIVQYCHNCNSLPPIKLRIYQNGNLKTYNADKYIDLEVCDFCAWRQKQNHMIYCDITNKYTPELHKCEHFSFLSQLRVFKILRKYDS